MLSFSKHQILTLGEEYYKENISAHKPEQKLGWGNKRQQMLTTKDNTKKVTQPLITLADEMISIKTVFFSCLGHHFNNSNGRFNLCHVFLSVVLTVS